MYQMLFHIDIESESQTTVGLPFEVERRFAVDVSHGFGIGSDRLAHGGGWYMNGGWNPARRRRLVARALRLRGAVRRLPLDPLAWARF